MGNGVAVIAPVLCVRGRDRYHCREVGNFQVGAVRQGRHPALDAGQPLSFCRGEFVTPDGHPGSVIAQRPSFHGLMLAGGVRHIEPARYVHLRSDHIRLGQGRPRRVDGHGSLYIGANGGVAGQPYGRGHQVGPRLEGKGAHVHGGQVKHHVRQVGMIGDDQRDSVVRAVFKPRGHIGAPFLNLDKQGGVSLGRVGKGYQFGVLVNPKVIPDGNQGRFDGVVQDAGQGVLDFGRGLFDLAPIGAVSI